MPSEIGNAVVNPATFVRPSPQQAQQESRSRVEGAQTDASPQGAQPAGSDALLRAPEPGTRGQGAENQLASEDGGSESGAAAQSAARPQPPEGGVGGNVDVTI